MSEVTPARTICDNKTNKRNWSIERVQTQEQLAVPSSVCIYIVYQLDIVPVSTDYWSPWLLHFAVGCWQRYTAWIIDVDFGFGTNNHSRQGMMGNWATTYPFYGLFIRSPSVIYVSSFPKHDGIIMLSGNPSDFSLNLKMPQVLSYLC